MLLAQIPKGSKQLMPSEQFLGLGRGPCPPGLQDIRAVPFTCKSPQTRQRQGRALRKIVPATPVARIRQGTKRLECGAGKDDVVPPVRRGCRQMKYVAAVLQLTVAYLVHGWL